VAPLPGSTGPGRGLVFDSLARLARETRCGPEDAETVFDDAVRVSPDRTLARLGLEFWRQARGGTARSNSGPGQLQPALVTWQFGPDAPRLPEDRDPLGLVFLFRLSSRFPKKPVLTRQGPIVEIAARRLALLEMARILIGLAGDRELLLLPDGWPPVPAADRLSKPPPMGVQILKAGTAGSPKTDRTPAVPDSSRIAGGFGPADRLQAGEIIDGLWEGRFDGVPLRLTPDSFLACLPPERSRIRSPRRLRAAFRAFLLQACLSGAELRSCPELRRSPAGRVAPGSAWVFGRDARRVIALGAPAEAAWRDRWAKLAGPRHSLSGGRGSPTAWWQRLCGRLGWLSGRIGASPKRGFRPYLTIPEGPVGEIDFELLSAHILRQRLPRDGSALFVSYYLDGIPCGCLGYPVHGIAPDHPEPLTRQVEEEFLLHLPGRFLRQLGQLLFDGAGRPGPAEPVASLPALELDVRPSLELVVATRDRSRELTRLLDSVSSLRQPVSVRIVDSTPTGSATRELAESRGLPYLVCPVPGKSRALNLGIASSRADVILFTDDDAVVDPDWSAALANCLDDDRISGVTGLVLPLEVRTPAQYLFEMHMEEIELGGLRRGFTEREFGRPYSPFRAAHLGSGANMAIRRQVFDRLGGFDPALSPGTPARAGEEIDLYFRLLQQGAAVVYTPRAIVRHGHRESMADLKRLLFNYGVSTGAFATRWLLREHRPLAFYYLFRWNVMGLLWHAWKHRAHYPASLLIREAAGCLWGPLGYLRSLGLQEKYGRRLKQVGS